MSENPFANSQLEVTTQVPKIGEESPLFGMVTSILNDSTSNFVVVLNYNVKLTIKNTTQEVVNTIKERVLEPGIFFTTITSYNENFYKIEPDLLISNPEEVDEFLYEGDCHLTVFGKRQELNG